MRGIKQKVRLPDKRMCTMKTFVEIKRSEKNVLFIFINVLKKTLL